VVSNDKIKEMKMNGINMETSKYKLDFNPNVSGSVTCVVTSQSGKEEEWYCSHYDAMKISSKPSVKSVKVIDKYDAGNIEGVLLYRYFQLQKLK
jgi:hypothetical protein